MVLQMFKTGVLRNGEAQFAFAAVEYSPGPSESSTSRSWSNALVGPGTCRSQSRPCSSQPALRIA